MDQKSRISNFKIRYFYFWGQMKNLGSQKISYRSREHDNKVSRLHFKKGREDRFGN